MEVPRLLSRATGSLCKFTTSSFLAPLTRTPATTRSFSSVPVLFAARPVSAKDRAAKDKARKRKKKHRAYKQYDLKEMQQFTLCEAMRYAGAISFLRLLQLGQLLNGEQIYQSI